jgi:outer membrane protein
LPVEYYDEEKYYNEVGSRWIGDWGSTSTSSGTGSGSSLGSGK